jgi:hypothetical protein
MMAERFHREVELEFPYFRSVTDVAARRFETKLPTAGSCRLHLLIGKRDLPKKVRLVRATGMVIDQYTPRVGLLPFSGLFVCTDPNGNRLLRSLEPPRHNTWDPKREGEEGAVKALAEIKEWIRKTLRQQIPHLSEDEFNEGNVPPELQEEDQEPDNPDAEDQAAENEPDLGGHPREAGPAQPVRRRIIARKKGRGTKGTKKGPGDLEDPRKGDDFPTGGKRRREGEGTGIEGLEPRVQLSARAFPISSETEAYDVILRSDKDYSGSVHIEAIGDDSGGAALALVNASIGDQKLAVEGARVDGLNIKADSSLRLRIKLRNPGKYAVRAILP